MLLLIIKLRVCEKVTQMKLFHHSRREKYRLNFYDFWYQILMNFKDHIFLTINCDQIGKNGEAFFLTNPGGLP